MALPGYDSIGPAGALGKPKRQYVNSMGPDQALSLASAPEYNSAARYANLNKSAADLRAAGASRLGDQTARFPGLASGQQTSQRLLDRDVMDKLLEAQGNLQAQGADQATTDRRLIDQYMAQNVEAANQRSFLEKMQGQQFQQQGSMFNRQANQAQVQGMQQAFYKAAGAA